MSRGRVLSQELALRSARTPEEDGVFIARRTRLQEIIDLTIAELGPFDLDSYEASFNLGQFLKDWGEYDAAARVYQSLYMPMTREPLQSSVAVYFDPPMAARTTLQLESLRCYLVCMDMLAEKEWEIPYDLINFVYGLISTHPHLAPYVVTGDRITSFWKTSTLIWAARYGHARLVGQLLQDGVDKNDKNEFGESAWKVADYSKFPGLRDVLEKPSNHRNHSESSNRVSVSTPTSPSPVVGSDTRKNSLKNRVKHLFGRRSSNAGEGESSSLVEEPILAELAAVNTDTRRAELE